MYHMVVLDTQAQFSTGHWKKLRKEKSKASWATNVQSLSAYRNICSLWNFKGLSNFPLILLLLKYQWEEDSQFRRIWLGLKFYYVSRGPL